MEERQDPHTGERFIPRRQNQIYANRQNQTDFNNSKARDKRLFFSQINKLLMKNRDILEKILNGESESYKSKDFLLGKGFNFGFLTHRRKFNDKSYTMIYDHGVLYKSDQNINIKKF